MYVIKVYFWNIDCEYEWSDLFIYLFEDKPNKEWLKSLYDGVNEAIRFEVLGELIDSEKIRELLDNIPERKYAGLTDSAVEHDFDQDYIGELKSWIEELKKIVNNE